MDDRIFYEKRILPIIKKDGMGETPWEMLSEDEKEQISELRLEEERVP